MEESLGCTEKLNFQLGQNRKVCMEFLLQSSVFLHCNELVYRPENCVLNAFKEFMAYLKRKVLFSFLHGQLCESVTHILELW